MVGSSVSVSEPHEHVLDHRQLVREEILHLDIDVLAWMLTPLKPSPPAAMATGLGLLERLWLPGLKGAGCAGEAAAETTICKIIKADSRKTI